METDERCDVQANATARDAVQMTAAAPDARDWIGADVDRKGPIMENRQIRIHGADSGARSAIQSGSDHDRSSSKPNKGIR